MSLTRAIALLVFVASSGCELTAELGAYSLADGETTDIATSSSDAGGETGTAGGSEAGDAGSGDGDPDPGDGDPGDGDLGDGDGDGQCTIDGSEDACLTCMKFLCCDQLSACDSEFGCNCMIECLAQSEPVTCAMTCSPGAAYFMLLQCQVTSCAAVCG